MSKLLTAADDAVVLLQLLDALQWSLDLGVQAITVYAFSIDNFRRGTDEVEALMTLAEQKLLELMEVRCLLHNHRSCHTCIHAARYNNTKSCTLCLLWLVKPAANPSACRGTSEFISFDKL